MIAGLERNHRAERPGHHDIARAKRRAVVHHDPRQPCRRFQRMTKAGRTGTKRCHRAVFDQTRTKYGEDIPNILFVRDQLLQVFLNLVLNSLDATEEGGTIEIATDADDDYVRVMVRDNGQGIDPADQARLFQPYFTTKSTGTGLGLFVCHKIVENAGGAIELLQSSPVGTTFVVSLPRQKK